MLSQSQAPHPRGAPYCATMMLVVSLMGCSSPEPKPVPAKFWPTIVELDVNSLRPRLGVAVDAEAVEARLKAALEKNVFSVVNTGEEDASSYPSQWRLEVNLDQVALDEEWKARPEGEVLGFPVVSSLVWYMTFFGAFSFEDRKYPVRGEIDLKVRPLVMTESDPVGLDLKDLLEEEGDPVEKSGTSTEAIEGDRLGVLTESAQIDFFDRYRFDQFLLSFVWPAVFNGDEEKAVEAAYQRAEDKVVERILRAVATHDFSMPHGDVTMLTPAPHSKVLLDRPTARFRITGPERLTRVEVRCGDNVVDSLDVHRLDAIATPDFDGSLVYYIDVPLGPLSKGSNLIQVVLEDRDVANFVLERAGDQVRDDLL